MKSGAAALVALALCGISAKAEEHPLFRWPLIGHVAKSADGRGVDIVAPAGEPVHAAAEGQIIYASDELASYGKMVVIRHADGFVTTYAHLSEIAVADGAKVKRGQIVGKSGQSGDAKQPELHFELREGDKSLDPLAYLKPR